MKYVSAIALSLGLAAAPAAFAEQTNDQDAKAAPKTVKMSAVKMSEAQLDQVTAGQGLVSVSVNDVADVQANPSVNAPVNVQVSVLGAGLGGGL